MKGLSDSYLKNSLQNLKFSDVTLECQINGSPNSSKGLKNWKISQGLVILDGFK